MESTVYRRDAAGAIIGTPEVQVELQQPIAVTPSANESQSRYKKSTSEDVESKPPKSAKTKRKYPRWIRVIRNIILGYLAFYIFLGIHASSSFHKVPAGPVNAIADTAGTNWLLVGSDSRDGLSKKERHALHTGGDFGPLRTDTIMVIHIGAKRTTLISLPRDSYVTIPAHTSLDGSKVGDRKNKINSAYGKGGAPLLVETVEQNTGLHIDHYMEVGFKGIRDITNAVNGVNMCIPNDVTDKNSGLRLKAGCQKLDGTKALAYVRMRYADPKGDLGRVERQQQFLSAVIHQVAKPAILLNPIAMYRLVGAGTDSVLVGKGDGIKDVAQLASAMRALSNGKGKLMTVPVSNPDATTAAGSSVLWDKSAAAKLFKSLGAN